MISQVFLCQVGVADSSLAQTSHDFINTFYRNVGRGQLGITKNKSGTVQKKA